MISIGIDAHKKKCIATLKQNNSKTILEQITFENRTKGFEELINHIRSYNEPATAVVESTANYWIRLHDTLEDNDVDCLLANPLQLKAIAKARLKDDKIDSNMLADLLRADLIPESFVPHKEERNLRHLVRTRIDLVYSRSSIKNKIHAILAKYEYDSPTTDVFSAKAREWLAKLELSWIDRMAADAYINTLDVYDSQINIFTTKIASLSKESNDVRLLMTIPGVDYLTALTIMSEIVHIKRFSTPWKLVSYSGLAPSRRDSGDTKRSGRITKQGSRWIRYAVVEAANTTMRCDGRLGNFYERIAARRGPQKAKVAVAKEMLVIMWHMLTNNEPYRTMNHSMTETKYKRMERQSRTV